MDRSQEPKRVIGNASEEGTGFVGWCGDGNEGRGGAKTTIADVFEIEIVFYMCAD